MGVITDSTQSTTSQITSAEGVVVAYFTVSQKTDDDKISFSGNIINPELFFESDEPLQSLEELFNEMNAAYKAKFTATKEAAST